MAVKPTKVSLDGSSTDITNAILNDMKVMNPNYSPDVRSDGTLQGIQAVGKIVIGNSDWANQFMRTLFNRIVFTVIQSFSFYNPLRKFKRGLLEAGDAVNEIAFDLAAPHGYDTTEDSEFPKQEKEFLYSAIHKVNYAAYYKKTINRNMLLKAFQTVNGMRELADQMINNLYQTAEVDEYIGMKYLVAKAYLSGYVKNIYIEDLMNNNKKVAGILKGISNDMTIVTGNYNSLGIPTSTDKVNQVVLINPIYDGNFEVDVLAYAFNADKAEINGQKIFYTAITAEEMRRMNKLTEHDGIAGVSPFTQKELQILKNVPIFVVDERFFMVFDYVFEMTDFFNPEKMYWNYWLHCWKILSVSPFVNAIAISSNEIILTSLQITPNQNVSVKKGGILQFQTTQEPNIVRVNPYWSVSGNTENGTYITQYGVLFVDKNEKATSIKVMATIEQDTPVTSEVTVTING